MKHTINVTILLVIFFFVAQIVGLFVTSEYIDIKESNIQGKTVIKNETYKNSIAGTPPEIKNQSISWIIIIMMVLVGTGLVLLIVKFRQYKIWKVWFFIAITMCIANAVAPFASKWGISGKVTIPLIGTFTNSIILAILVGIILAFLKLIKKNIIVHNISEILIYGGLVAFLMPLINMVSAFALLIAISIYDMYAVWSSKHMVSMAQFQTEAKMFAGLMINYKLKREKTKRKIPKTTIETKSAKSMKSSKRSKTEETRTAILGGGDIAFPLIFASAAMAAFGSFSKGIVIICFATIALSLLFAASKQGKFYPAMPFLSAGCFVGYVVAFLI